MGKVRQQPDPALVVISAIYAQTHVLQEACVRMEQAFGKIHNCEYKKPFTWTDYYTHEMGPGLVRTFLYTERLCKQELLSQLKLFTNHIENDFLQENQSRRINLDPGLLTLANFVLATTKNYSHRIYLRDKIFAEVTLQFKGSTFEPLEWTYPDYGSKEVRNLLCDLRNQYKLILRSNPRLINSRALF